MGGVLDHDGNADLADEMAESMDDWDDVWIVQTGLAVEGSIDWNVVEDDEDDDEDDFCALPA